MASESKPEKPAGGGSNASSASNAPSSTGLDETLRPFQEAATKFLQSHATANESFFKQRVQVWLDLQDSVRKVEQEANEAVVDLTRKVVNALAQQPSGPSVSPEAVFTARMQAQLDYEREVRRIHADAQAKVMSMVQKAYGEDVGGEPIRGFVNQRQDAYQAYLKDLQRAWSSTKAADPQTLNAIASTILMTMNAAS